MKNLRIKQKFENLENALIRLQEILAMPLDKNRVIDEKSI